MIRRIQSLLSILVVASASMLGGCAVSTAPDGEAAGSAVDALVDLDADGTPDAEEETADEPAPPSHVAPRLDVARGNPVRDQQDWATTEPQPVPWHETKNSATGANDDDDDGNPLWPSVGGGRDDDR